MRVLVTGGVRSGKSAHAESLLADRTAVRYVAPGPVHDDADWAARITAHQARRPTSWSTVETHDLATALATDQPVLVDCLGTWLTAGANLLTTKKECPRSTHCGHTLVMPVDTHGHGAPRPRLPRCR